MRCFLALTVALVACTSAPSTAPATSPEAQLYALTGQVASLLAAGKLAPAEAVTLNQDLQVAKAELSAGLTAQAQQELAIVQAAIVSAEGATIVPQSLVPPSLIQRGPTCYVITTEPPQYECSR